MNLKKYRREIVIFSLIALLSFISFGLGYLTAKDTARTPIIIEKASK